MFDAPVIQILIGLGTLFLVFSVVASAIAESLGSWSNLRGKMLKFAIAHLLHEQEHYRLRQQVGFLWQGCELRCTAKNPSELLTEKFYASSAVRALHNEGRLPSYIPERIFADRVIEYVARHGREDRLPVGISPERLLLEFETTILGTSGEDAVRLEDGTEKLAERDRTLRRELARILTRASEKPAPVGQEWAAGRLENLRLELEGWYNATMDRARGWFKRKLHVSLLVIGLVLAIVLNIDIIALARALYDNAALRASLADQADAVLATEGARQGLEALGKVALPLGWGEIDFRAVASAETWKSLFSNPMPAVSKIAGLVLTAAGISMGAPFWFDVLNKLVSLRSAGKRLSSDEKAAASAGAEVTVSGAGGVPAIVPVATAKLLPVLPENYWESKVTGPTSLVPDPDRAHFTAALMGRLSDLAYRDEFVLREILAPGEPEDLEFLDVEETQVFAYRPAGSRTLVVAFRGTEATKIQDMVTDARFKLVETEFSRKGDDTPVTARVHRGFRQALDHVWERLAKMVETSTEVWFTGHSLGGALATLASLRAREYLEDSQIHLHNYGSPRVGDADFAKHFQDADRSTGIAAIRFINHEDLVTRVPPRALGYRHVGHIRYFNGEGVLQEGVQGWWRFLNTVLNASEDFRAGTHATLEDHGMVRYVQRLDSYEAV